MNQQLDMYECSHCGYLSADPQEFPHMTFKAGVVVDVVCRGCTPTVEINCVHGYPTFAVCPHCMSGS